MRNGGSRGREARLHALRQEGGDDPGQHVAGARRGERGRAVARDEDAFPC